MKASKPKAGWWWHGGALGLALLAGVLIGRTSVNPSTAKSPVSGDGGRTVAGSMRATGGVGTAAASERQRTATKAREGAGDANLAVILESESRLDRMQRLLAFLDRLPAERFAAIYQEMRDSPLADLRNSERSLILQAWAERDPLAALAFLQQNGAQDWERETTVATWAAKDPQAAFAWAATAPDEGKVNNWLLGAMRGIASTNPGLAAEFLSQMAPDETRSHALRAAQPFVMHQGFDQATRWIDGFADDGLRGEAARMLAGDLASLDPTRAGAWNASIKDTELRRDVSETVSDRWAAVDLNAARRWVERLPEDTRTEAAEGVARHYARQDPQQAAQWLTGLGTNPDLDGARRILIEESFRADPVTSLGFVANLADPQAREAYYHRLVRGWLRQDADAARNWVQQNATILPSGVVRRATQ